jgi:ferredoxin-nitrite reductase
MQVVPLAEAVLLVFRDHGPRGDRQKTRLMWLVEEIGSQAFIKLVSERMGGVRFAPAVERTYEEKWVRRDVLGIHPQKQDGLNWVCC